MSPKPLLYIGLAVLLTGLAAGCLGKKPEPYVAYQPPAPDAENAYWRRQYETRRPTPPKQYSVPPVPPRNNEFGEFDDQRYQVLDQQPQLPSLPADDFRPPSAGGFAPPSVPQAMPSPEPTALRRSAGPARMPERVLTPSPSNLSGPGLGGIDTGAHYYPVEQLIYGGDFPDLDQPESYRLMPKDQVTITVKDHPEFSGPAVIQPDGTIGIVNTPDLVRLRGLTVEEAAEAVRRVLVVYVRGECLVRVQANRASGGYYFVFGDVLQPGRFPMGLEPVKLSEAVLAANWEANPARRDVDGDDLGPSFPAAAPRGRYVSPRSADLARVMVVTPHRSQPARTIHDVRASLMGMTGDDPLIRPGQIVIVPSLEAEKNAQWGLEVSEGPATGRGFSGASSPARLPEVAPLPKSKATADPAPETSAVELNMEIAHTMTSAGGPKGVRRINSETDYPNYRDKESIDATEIHSAPKRKNRVEGW